MARYKLQGRARDTWGNAVSGLDIYIYVAGTNRIQDAIVYTASTGSTAISASPQISSDTYGFFSFWVDDIDYTASTTKFDIYADGLEYTYVDVFNIKHHGTMGGLAPDDHVRYPTTSAGELITGSWRFSQPLSGATPTANVHFTTKGYTDTQYLSALGDTVVTGNWTFTNPVTGAAPSANNHLTTKQYVDTQVLSVSAGGGLIEASPNTFAVNPDNLTIAVSNDQVILKPTILGTAHTFSETLAASGNLNVGGDLDVVGNSAFGNGAAPNPVALLLMNHDFDESNQVFGQHMTIENLANFDSPLSGTTGLAVTVRQSSSILHNQVIGFTGTSNVSAPSATITLMEGMSGLAYSSADGSIIDTMIGGRFRSYTGFSMANQTITNLIGGKFEILEDGSGDISITNAYGALITSPGFTSTGTTDNLYGLYIEDQSNAGFINDYNVYSAGASSTNFFEGGLTTQGTLDVGIDNSVNGSINVYGDSANTGGQINIYNSANFDGSVDYFIIRADDEDLNIGPVSNPDSLTYWVGPDEWHFTSGTIALGVADVQQGGIVVYSAGAGSSTAGSIRMNLPPDYDTTFSTYNVSVYQDQFQIGPSTGTNRLVFDGGNSRWDFECTNPTQFSGAGVNVTGGDIYVGVADSAVVGQIIIYSDDSSNGGKLNLHTGPAYDTTITYYHIGPFEDDLYIGPSTDTDALKYDGLNNVFQFTKPETRFGTEDTAGAGGLLTVYGNNSNAGGEIQLHLGAPYDTTITHYQIQGRNDDLEIGPSTDIDALKYDGGLNLWQFTRAETRFGTEDSITEGLITVYGDNSNAGGKLQLHLGAGYDTTIPHYQIRGFNDDLYIGPSTDPDTLKYDGGLNLWQFTTSETRFGTEDSVGAAALLTLYSDNSTDGGRLQLHTGPAYDTTITHYHIGPFEDDLYIGPSTDMDALKYDGALNLWQFTKYETIFGTADSAAGGKITIHSDNSTNGGMIQLHTGPAYDTTILYYQIRPFEDDFHIGPSTDTDALKYDGANNRWTFTATGGTRFETPITVDTNNNNSTLTLGALDTARGKILMYGDSEYNPIITMYKAAAYDTLIDFYRITLDTGDDNLWIGPNTDPDSLKYDGALNLWHFTRGETRFGTADSPLGGQLTVYSDDSSNGGKLNLHTGPAYDTTITHYHIGPFEDDLYIGPSTDTDALKYDGGIGKWIIDGITIDDSRSIEWNSVPTNNLESSGNITTMTVSGPVSAGHSLYMTSAGNVELSDADSVTTMPVRVLAIENGTGNKNVLQNGFIRDDSWNWTPGKTLYASTSAGIMTQVAPSGSGDQVQVLGYATHADRAYFNPEYTLVQVA